MERYEAGMLAQSAAGHDLGRIYVIVKCEGAYVYLADGRLKRADAPKKKKKKHIRLIRAPHEELRMEDAQIRRVLKEYRRNTVKPENESGKI